MENVACTNGVTIPENSSAYLSAYKFALFNIEVWRRSTTEGSSGGEISMPSRVSQSASQPGGGTSRPRLIRASRIIIQ